MKEKMELLFSSGDFDYFVRAYIYMSDQHDLLILKKRRPGRDDEIVTLDVYTNKPLRESLRKTLSKIEKMTVICDFESNLDGRPFMGRRDEE